MRILLVAGAVILALQSGCIFLGRPFTDAEILQNTKAELQQRLAKQERTKGLMRLQAEIDLYLSPPPHLYDTSVVLEDSTSEEQGNDEHGNLYRRKRDVIDFWVVMKPPAEAGFTAASLEGVVRKAFGRCGLEIETFWKTGQANGEWALHGFASEPPKKPSAAILKTCPAGHSRLRDVPIAYGYIIPDADFLKKVANHEIIRGGCTGGMADTVVLCLDCGFRYDTVHKYWELTADKPAAFEPKLSSLILELPLPSDAQPTYQQKIRAKRVGEEAVWFYSTQSPASLSSLIKKFLESRGLKVQEHGVDLTSDWGEKKISVNINEHEISKDTSVHFAVGDEDFDAAGFREGLLTGEKFPG